MKIVDGLNQLLTHRASFIVVGLTGRTGSGCTTATQVLARDFARLQMEAVPSPLVTPEHRKYRIIRQFGERNWTPFRVVSVTQVIVSFMLEADSQSLEDFLKPNIRERDRAKLFEEIHHASKRWQCVKNVVLQGSQKVAADTNEFLKVWEVEVANLLGVLRKTLHANYATVFQAFGDNLRSSGSVLDTNFNPQKLFSLPERVAEIVVALRQLDVEEKRPARIAIDAIRNPFEIHYFRQRFAPFYLLAITTPDTDRKSRLAFTLNMKASDIQKLDAKEYPTINKPLSGDVHFVSQNIQACIEKADVFIRNEGAAREAGALDLKELAKQLVTFVSLMQHPGLVTPTKTERCMQIAFSAKANSGCISRQVGAAVTDTSYSIKAVGWNDVPAGQVPCLLRAADDLIAGNDADAFSDYELQDEKFRKYMEGRYKVLQVVASSGRNASYCFKSEYNNLEKKNNQVHTRSLHAEENAFLQLSKYGGTGVEDGVLFSTASPCELCSKKAFQLGIKEIFYIDPYPGISLSHVLGSGVKEKRPKVTLFSGAVGQAFHRLYDPILPYKDEMEVFLGSSSEPTEETQ
jgi:deoxycytidylate deaminase/dephospho-CoA kinase